jgi:signal transduction histidine kinase
MKKILILSFVFCFSFEVRAIEEKNVIQIVKNTIADLTKDASGTLTKINNAEAPYKDKTEPSLYVFVYSPSVEIVAHANDKMLVTKNFKNKPDVCGCNFRDELVENALGSKTDNKKCKKEGNWVFYAYQNPKTKKLEQKKSYSEKVKASDGKDYVVVSGLYVGEMNGCKK